MRKHEAYLVHHDDSGVITVRLAETSEEYAKKLSNKLAGVEPTELHRAYLIVTEEGRPLYTVDLFPPKPTSNLGSVSWTYSLDTEKEN